MEREEGGEGGGWRGRRMVREEGGWKDKSSHLVTSVKVIMTLYIVFTLTKYIL